MRTNLLFGDVRYEDDVKTAKEIERRQWLGDLQKQIEDNKRGKFTQQETERRQDFLHENVKPLIQEAANRHQQQKDTSITNNQYNSVVQQAYEAGELAKYDKRSPLVDKLKLLLTYVIFFSDVKSKGAASNQNTGEKLFGPTYESSSKQNMNNKVDPLHLNVAADRQQQYRRFDARRDEAVNTVDSTFRR
jgi:hypothetical protein